MRAAVLRADSVGQRIGDWLGPGDPPYLRGVAASCRSLRAIEGRAHLLRVVPPNRLVQSHRDLVQEYTTLRAGCAEARSKALAAAVADDRFWMTGRADDRAARRRALNAARAELSRFRRSALPAFAAAAGRWRSEVLRDLAAAGTPAPDWLVKLPRR
jgi:hypothetical protein